MDNKELYLRQIKQLFWDNEINPEMHQLERFANYADLIVQKNEIVNLISRKDIENVVENHLFICALINKYLPERTRKFIDIGTGGGFPGIPLAIMNPMMRGVLVDSIAKKTEAVQEFREKLMLGNIQVENSRVEDKEFIEKYQNSFDLVVSRATVPLIILFRYAIPLIKDKAFLVALKGGNLDEEIKKAEMKYKAYIKKMTIFEMAYKPSNLKNEKDKKLIVIELVK